MGVSLENIFQDVCKKLQIQHFYSRSRTPKDHAEIERFNRTSKFGIFHTYGIIITEMGGKVIPLYLTCALL